jgi:cytochrome c
MKSTIRTMGVSALVLAAALGAGCSAGEEAEEARPEAAATAPAATEEAVEPVAAAPETAMEEPEMAAAEEEAAEPEMMAAEEAPAEEEPMQLAQADVPAEEDAGGEMTQASGELPADHPALGGDPAAGKRVFIKCMSCHAVQEGQNRVGPSLYGIVGRPAGSVEKFNYSDANANSGIVWTKDVMFEYLENPQEYIPGTRMVFPGLPSEKDRRDVIAYLESVSE